MPAFMFLSTIALFSFFAFEPPSEVAKQTASNDVVADTWLREEQESVALSVEEPDAGKEEGAEKGE